MRMNLLIGIIVIGSVFGLTKILTLKSEVKDKEEIIVQLTKEYILSETNYLTKSKAYEELSTTVKNDKINYEDKLKEYSLKQTTKPNIKYIEVESNECKDVLLQLDDIREKGY